MSILNNPLHTNFALNTQFNISFISETRRTWVTVFGDKSLEECFVPLKGALRIDFTHELVISIANLTQILLKNLKAAVSFSESYDYNTNAKIYKLQAQKGNSNAIMCILLSPDRAITTF